jgi:hypothetical protein
LQTPVAVKTLSTNSEPQKLPNGFRFYSFLSYRDKKLLVLIKFYDAIMQINRLQACGNLNSHQCDT